MADENDIAGLRKLLYRELELRHKNHQHQHKQESEALQVARNAMEYRLEGMNEFREQLTQQGQTFASRENVEVVREHILQRLRDIENTQAILNGRLWALGAALTTGLAIVGILVTVVLR